MIHTIVIPDNQIISFTIPQNYVGKELEVIVFEKEEGNQEKLNLPKKRVSFNALSIDTKNFKFDRNEANRR
jgi:hypothetical protein